MSSLRGTRGTQPVHGGPDQEAAPPDHALDRWIRRHQVPLWRFLRLCGCAADVADDLAQEALLAALHKHIPELPDAAAAAWLRGAATNLWRMHLRSNSRRARRDDLRLAQLALQQNEEQGDSDLFLQALRTCLQRVDGRARTAIEMHYGRGDTRQQIGVALGLRPDGVKTFLRRVRDALRQCVLRRLGSGAGPT